MLRVVALNCQFESRHSLGPLLPAPAMMRALQPGGVVYCPECRAEYRDGFTECSDCRGPLVGERPTGHKGPGIPDLEWVTVLEGTDRLVLASAKGLLEEAGIPFYVLGDEMGPRLAMVDEFIHPWWRIQVGLDREEEVKKLLKLLGEANPVGDTEEEENPRAPE
jgi:hypothetical protein